MRTLREELSANLSFDGFILATITETPDGPLAEGYQHVGGAEEVVPPVALAVTGPSREAYETGNPGLVRKSPWERSFDGKALELGVASAADERQMAEAVFSVAGDYLGSTHMVLAYVDVAGQVAGFAGATAEAATAIGPVPIENAPFFRRLIEGGTDVQDAVAH